MSKYGEPLRRVEATIMRNDGKVVVQGTSHRDSRCTKCQCSASTFVHVESAERIIACVNACASITHPERLPGLMEAVRFVLDDVTRQALGDDTLPQVMAAVNDLRRAYAAMMGETP